MKKNMRLFICALSLLGVSTSTVQAAGENEELDNFPIFRCTNSNNWAHYNNGQRAECTTYKNAAGKKFKIRAHMGDQSGSPYISISLGTKSSWGDYLCYVKQKWLDRPKAKDCINTGLANKEKRSRIFGQHGIIQAWPKQGSMTIEKGYDRAGPAYAKYNMPANATAYACASSCAVDKNCKYFTFAPGVCFFKSSANFKHSSPTVTSGRKWR